MRSSPASVQAPTQNPSPPSLGASWAAPTPCRPRQPLGARPARAPWRLAGHEVPRHGEPRPRKYLESCARPSCPGRAPRLSLAGPLDGGTARPLRGLRKVLLSYAAARRRACWPPDCSGSAKTTAVCPASEPPTWRLPPGSGQQCSSHGAEMQVPREPAPTKRKLTQPLEALPLRSRAKTSSSVISFCPSAVVLPARPPCTPKRLSRSASVKPR